MRTLSRLILTIFCFGLLIPAALAVDTPTLDDIVSPIDATKAVISGTTEADYKSLSLAELPKFLLCTLIPVVISK